MGWEAGSVIEYLRNVAVLLGYSWHEYQIHLKEQGVLKHLRLDFETYYSQMSFDWNIYYGVKIRIHLPPIDLARHGLKGHFPMEVSTTAFKNPYVYDCPNMMSREEKLKLEKQIVAFFPGIKRGRHFETCHWCEDYRLCEEGEEGFWTCETCRDKQRKLMKADNSGYLYIFGSEEAGYYKIGASKIPDKRLKYYATRLPFDVEMLYLIPADDKYEAERQLHGKFSDKQERREWFKLDRSDIDFISRLREFQGGQWAMRSEAT